MLRSTAKRFASLLPYLAIAIAGVVVAYLELFSYFPTFDDEGYYLSSIQSFTDGGNLYSQVYSEYGPLYYELFGAFFKLTGIEVTNDAGRFIVLVLWVGTALLYGFLTELLTKRRVLGILAALAAFSILRVHRVEPMAPVGFVALLTALSLAPLTAPTRVSPKRLATLLGVSISALALIKINVGALYGVAVLAAALMVLAPERRRALSFAAAVALLVVTPIALSWSNNDLTWVRQMVAIEVAAILAIAITVWPRAVRPPLALLIWLRTLALAGIATAVAVCAVIVALGTGPRVLLDGVLLDPSRHPKVILLPPVLPSYPVLLGILAVVAAAVIPRVRARLSGDALLSARVVARMLVALVIVTAATQTIDLGPLSAAIGLPALLAWVALRAPAELGEPPQWAFARLCIVLIAVVMTMTAYPIALSRELIAALPFVLIAALIASDGLRLLRTAPKPAWASQRVLAASGAAVALVFGAQLVNSGLVKLGREGRDGFMTGERVHLHGA